MSRLIIAGGGLAGCVTALALARRSSVKLVLVEEQPRFGGNHTWSYFDSDIPPANRWVLENLVEFRWPEHEVRFPRRHRTIRAGYNSLTSPALDRKVQETLRTDQFRLGARIREMGAKHVTLASGERLEADGVIDARGGARSQGLDLCWQKFVGRVFEFKAGHGIARPIIMDATVQQLDGYRFVYLLPFSSSRLLIEETYYATSPSIDQELVGERIARTVQVLAKGSFRQIGEETGVLPVVLDGDFDRFWPDDDPIPRIGVQGGFFHPTTSYSLPDAVANAALLAQHKDFSTEGLARLTRARAEKLWRERAFYRLLNRMLFRAAEPDRSYKVLEHFYRLPDDVIARFYAARLTRFDKLRVLSGRPPVALGRALMAMKRTAA